MKRFLITAIVSSVACTVFAQDNSPIGLWKSIDDQTGKPKALIRINDMHGELKGKIEKLYREPGEEQNPKCIKCEGVLKDQPIIGMTILFGMKQDGNEYVDGQIIDPANGKVYKSKMSLVEEGKKLHVRGYIGVPLLGRTQTWIREE